MDDCVSTAGGDHHAAGLASLAWPISPPPPAGPAGEPAEGRRALGSAGGLGGAILETAPDAILAIDDQGRVVEWNPAAGLAFGYTRAEALGRPIDELIVPEPFREAHRRGLARCREAGRSPLIGRRVAVEAMRADGSTFLAELALTAVSPTGGPPLFVAHLRDLSGRRRAERGRCEDDRRSREIFEGAAGGIFRATPEGRIVVANPAFARMLGDDSPDRLIARASELGARFYVDPARLDELVDRLRREGAVRGFEAEVRRADGRHAWLSLSVGASRDARGALRSLEGIAEDVTERRRAEEELRASEARLQAVLDSSKAIAYLKDLEGRYLLINRRWAELFGVTKQSVVGRTDQDIFPADIADAFRANDLRVLAAGRAIELEELAPHEDGRHTYLTIKAPLYDPTGAPYGTCGISTDITARKRTEEALRQSEETFRQAFESAAVGMALVAPDGRWVRVNRALCAIVGRSEDELLATTFQAVTHPDDVEADVGLAHALLDGEIPHYQMEKRYIHASGRDVWVLLSVSLVRDADGRPVHFVSQIEDVSPRKRAEEAIRERASLAELGSEVGICLTRQSPLPEVLQRCAESLVRHLGAAFARIWTLDPGGEVLELQASAGMYTHLDGPHGRIPVGRYKIGQIAERRQPLLSNAVIDDPRISDRRWAAREGMVAFAGYPLLVDDRLLGVIAVFARRPLSGYALQALGSVANGIALAIERKQAEARLAYQATHDGLTGLPNRSMLLQSLDRCTATDRGPSARCALLLLDLDRFKEINDTFGHHYGDETLKQLNPRLLGCVRATDLVARLGGDEFGILLPDADEEVALRVADRILLALEAPITVEGRPLDVGVSIGIALCPDHGTDAASLLQRADVAMYVAKRGHSGRVVYAPDLSDCSPQRLSLIGDLRRGIEGDQLLLHYQPKVELTTGRVVGAEALVRWLHPREGLIPPDRFIPLAEQTGLIRPLSLWSLEAAARQCRAWHEAGLVVGVAVNLSPDNLRDELLLDRVREVLEASGMPPGWLTLEVTETAMIDQPAHARRVLDGLHEMGIRISIDDFGTGYSSLAFLKELPVDEVKVDRTFVRDMVASERDACIVRAVIDLGHNLGLKVVAEGVEDASLARRLASWGCDSAQGFYYSRPLPPPEFASWLACREPSIGPHRRPRR